MALFLGYDPGGYSKGPGNGVAAAEIREDGTFAAKPKTKTFHYASEVREWLYENSSAKALGVDTLLAWSFNSYRTCDDALRTHYKDTVISQNSLASSMTINGVHIARTARKLGIPIIESHPKLLLRTALKRDREGKSLKSRFRQISNDDETDALIAAWCASRWHFKCWKTDLYCKMIRDDELYFPAGKAFYPWPEPVPDLR